MTVIEDAWRSISRNTAPSGTISKWSGVTAAHAQFDGENTARIASNGTIARSTEPHTTPSIHIIPMRRT
ncbi:MAG: hypothetical protein F2788_00055 [Actinobacteria bacterium]|nr:hypothetical protein [Actinomycetota bacterium]MUH52891.1 hypothetical protein [Actinomycetota bacterium]